MGKSVGSPLEGNQGSLEGQVTFSPESDVPSDPGKSEELTTSDQENLEDLNVSDKDGSELSQETITQISAGEFKLDFEPSFDVVREVEIKKALQKKIQKAKTLQCRFDICVKIYIRNL